MRKTQIFIDGVPKMMDDDKIVFPSSNEDSIKHYKADMSLDTVAIQDEIDAKRVVEIDTRLNQIDIDSVRSMRAITRGNSNQFDTDKLTALDTEADGLRVERATLV